MAQSCCKTIALWNRYRGPPSYLSVLAAVTSLTEPVSTGAGIQRTAASVLAVSAEDGVTETSELCHVATTATSAVKMPELGQLMGPE